MRAIAEKLVILVFASVLGLLVLELGAMQIYARYTHRPFTRAEIAKRLMGGTSAEPELAAAGATGDRTVAERWAILHPYFGFVANPSTARVNAFGFVGREPFATRAPTTALVAVLGGSVADDLIAMSGDVLRSRLAGRGAFAGRRIELIDLALGGYKQPQQLIVLATMLSLGAQFDVVVNVDGFNEIDLAADNLQDGVNPFYPYLWKLHVRDAADTSAALHLTRIDMLRAQREHLRRRFARWPVAHSVFLLTLWDLLDRRQEAALRAQTFALRRAAAASAGSPQQTGPPVRFSDDEAMYFDYAEAWARSSIEMALLCAGFGIRYVHFLQPNQYLPASKQLTADELETAYDPSVADTRRIASAYPILRERGKTLRDQGVDFVDLTMLFRDEHRTVYSDTCCHLNRLGNDQLADAIAQKIAENARDPGRREKRRRENTRN